MILCSEPEYDRRMSGISFHYEVGLMASPMPTFYVSVKIAFNRGGLCPLTCGGQRALVVLVKSLEPKQNQFCIKLQFKNSR
jgi:hypothetical protein